MSATTIESTGLAQGTWTLDASHSTVGFTVRHAGISKVRGQFTDVAGELTLGETLADAAVTATIQAASFSSGDAGRDGHVKSADFFDVETFTTLSFASSAVTGDEEDFELTGELTIRGISKTVTFKGEFNGVAVDPFGATRAGFEAKTVISRKEFGLTWNAALEAGGVLVSDKVTITLDVAFVKAA
ncbi:polyisoprenoid-binding protein YceI [Arthrobacter stackebrandtii]|uniref:Polyisoprenoid-binding protein YceI n=1 Tax=Arthrobacter stackebrandtii TaxID=272161 RepID=A0ABS4YU74_9MICC|nr:YceI family protein [Arthrobacter stackebrandtii]MBP2412337.1 polyisoprenoid-binding protein YceI [Arthrobacter stackebrandtii]PYH02113.1 polyisoprenoid-binding protein [Arthrobacter stackebrandtii]